MKEKELLRLQGLKKMEEDIYSQGTNYICGIDEAGRGPLAGPVVVASVIMPKDSMIESYLPPLRILSPLPCMYPLKISPL